MAKGPMLTRRQVAVVEAKAAGKTRREIAAELGISFDAVRHRIRRARKRAHVRYGRALAGPGKPPVKFKPFSLLPTDNV